MFVYECVARVNLIIPRITKYSTTYPVRQVHTEKPSQRHLLKCVSTGEKERKILTSFGPKNSRISLKKEYTT
jgi:hypothetical protein